MAERVTTPMVRRNGVLENTSWDEALREIETLTGQAAGKIYGVASARMSNEELFLFKEYIMETCGGAGVDFRCDDSHTLVAERQDNLLRRKDKHPNTRGALMLGTAGEASPAQGIAAAGLVVIYKQDAAAKMPGAIAEMKSRGAKLVVFASRMDATAQAADVLR